MQWPNLLSKLSPECVYPILRDGQCKPVSDYSNTPNMSSDQHDYPPERSATDDQDEGSSIGDSSLLAPPTSHRHMPDLSGLQPDPHEPQSFLDILAASHDLSTEFATTLSIRSAGASSGPMRAVIHPDHSDHFTPPNPHPISPHPFQSHGHASPPDDQLPRQSLVSRDYYAAVESIPQQNYVPPPRTESSSAPFFPPGTGGTSLFSHTRGATLPALSIPNPTAVVPPNSELARPPRFTFAPPGADVPADPVASTSTTPASPSSARSWRDKVKVKRDKTSHQPTQEGSGSRARSNSWTSVFRRRSGRQPGPAPLTPDAPPQLTASDWCDLAQWAYRATDNREDFASHADIPVPVEPEGSSSYDRALPPLPPHLSHLPAPSAPLVRTNSSTSALNPFLAHRSFGLPALSWDLRIAARAILFPGSGPGAPAVPMGISDYTQPATWPPCGALRIGAIGGHQEWRWPVDVRNPAGVRCGDVFYALIANLHEFVRYQELADMPPDHVTIIASACAARVAAGFPPGWSSSSSSDTTSAAAPPPDAIRRVDCLLGHTHFRGLQPGPGTGEWTMFVGAP